MFNRTASTIQAVPVIIIRSEDRSFNNISYCISTDTDLQPAILGRCGNRHC